MIDKSEQELPPKQEIPPGSEQLLITALKEVDRDHFLVLLDSFESFNANLRPQENESLGKRLEWLHRLMPNVIPNVPNAVEKFFQVNFGCLFAVYSWETTLGEWAIDFSFVMKNKRINAKCLFEQRGRGLHHIDVDGGIPMAPEHNVVGEDESLLTMSKTLSSDGRPSIYVRHEAVIGEIPFIFGDSLLPDDANYKYYDTILSHCDALVRADLEALDKLLMIPEPEKNATSSAS